MSMKGATCGNCGRPFTRFSNKSLQEIGPCCRRLNRGWRHKRNPTQQEKDEHDSRNRAQHKEMRCRVDAIFEIVVSHLDEDELAKVIYETQDMKRAIEKRLLFENPDEFDTMRHGKTRKSKRKRGLWSRDSENIRTGGEK